MSAARHRTVEVDGVRLDVHVESAQVRGRSPAGRRCSGVAVVHLLRTKDVEVALADVSWSDGTRCVQALPGSTTAWVDAVPRLVVRSSPRHARLVWVETRTALRAGNRVQSRRVDAFALRQLTGLRIPRWLTHAPRMAYGSRADLLGDTGHRRNEPCAVFEPDYYVGPAVLWSVYRLLPARHDLAEVH